MKLIRKDSMTSLMAALCGLLLSCLAWAAPTPFVTTPPDSTTTAPNMATFSLEVKNCPTSLGGIKTTISGNPYTNDATILLPGTSDSRNATSALGVKISRASASTDYFKIFSGTNTSESGSEVIIWTADEMDKAKDGKVMLLARLVPTGEYSKTNPGIGQFQATATFNFSYE